MSDEFLARRVKHGDDQAFAELARRYEPLVRAATRRVIRELGVHDARQAALLGLYDACIATDGRRPYAGIARLNVRWGVSRCFEAATARKHRLLSDAERDGLGPDGALARIAAPVAHDPAVVIELRDRLREHAQAPRRRAQAPRIDRRRRYTDEQIEQAIALVTQGSSIPQAARAVGARYHAVLSWVSRRDDLPEEVSLAHRRASAPDGNLNRRYSDAQIEQAVAMVKRGSTITAAAKAVGASHPTIVRWVRQAA